MAAWLELGIALLAIYLAWRLIAAMLRKPKAGPAMDPNAYVGAPRKHPPDSRSGALALEEPDEDESE